MTTKAQQSTLDNALVALKNQRVIDKCNMRINLGMKSKEATYQVFWATVNKHNASYRFKIDNKRFSMNVEVFRDILNICHRIPGQEFVEPPSEEEALSFIRELGHYGEIKYITDVSGLDKIRLSRVQILWGMYYKKNLDFVALIWEELAYQIDNRDSKKQDKMFYPIFTKIIIHYLLEKDKSISMRNRTFMHTARDDSLLGTMRFVSRHEDTQVYGVPDEKQRKISGSDEGTNDDDEDDTEDDEGNDGDDETDGNDDNDNDSDDNDDDSDHKRTKLDRGESPNLNQFNEEHEEEESVDEFTGKDDDDENEDQLDDDEEELYKDVNVNLRKEDVEMTDANQGGADQHNVSQESGFEQEEEDAHKLLNFENVSPADNEIASLMDTTVRNEEPSERDTSEIKQVDQYAQAISSNPAIVDRYMYNKLREAIHKSIQSHNAECREEAQAEKEEYIDLVDSTMRTIIREEVKTQLPQILPKAISDFATPSTYEVTASLTEHELTKILLDKIEERKSHLIANYKRELYDTLVKSYNNDKDLFETYGEVFTLKRSQDEKDKNQDLSAGSDRGTKKGSLARKLSHKKIQEEPSHTVDDSRMQKNQDFDTGNNDEQPNDEAAPKNGWFKKPERPPTPDPDRNKRHQVDFRPPQTWISFTTRVEKPHTSFDELMDTLIDFSAYVINQLNITNLTQELLVGPAFNLLKGTCKSLTELEYYFKESSKATTE
nr:hypothetical protein [Tanacetum cinerariifolium]